ncbi:Dual oxidase 1 [Fulvia fulva]|uniref:Dual oxidase 1 n=1 Tax=Passalora fulva TaxID=5499 RepID=A0A9Q8UQL5_PASFU|nr:Dual oxidase 1 [Fulvia fulva]KAK4622043.1 Dual oxidase 1 [Fulvia fulva]KAK4622393.1 Dual oxidase 1 [Fulvia fulva]UJO18807.1 Dual oxidase 1 [Fulvia fulva]WPV16735.1 Dual oxidase 1 [Fulvia fulva]WPV31145.1 Dual oxidase 1 [Fulvia fulva]
MYAMEGLYPVISKDFTLLSEKEINDFFDDLDKDKDGKITFEELEATLHEVHEELAPKLQKHHILHPHRRDLEKNAGHSKGDGLHAFLCRIMPECGAQLERKEFVEHVKRWEVPSQKQADSQENDKEDRAEEQRLPFRRRMRAYCAVHAPNILFVAFVVACLLGIGLWQMVIYIKNPAARAALGWGVIVAKACAGVLYPTLFFMVLSMSRPLSTFLRRFYALSRFINWDHSQKLHIIMSITGLTFATLHAIGHLTGSMLYGSRRGQGDDVASYLGASAVNAEGYRPYVWYVRSLPGWTGVTALGLFWTISLLSMPYVRNYSYEIFQLGHLLMFPMFSLLCAHGTAALLQTPMMGYWLAFPVLLVIFERVGRVAKGFMSVPARMKVLEGGDAVVITVKEPRGKDWKYSAGQYLLLQVPKISLWQWHPFTISSCRGDELQVHIKMEGDWTEALKDKMPVDEDIKVGIDGPYGAPAQRFYDYDYSIIVGGGIGITPFSAILTDLEENFSQ